MYEYRNHIIIGALCIFFAIYRYIKVFEKNRYKRSVKSLGIIMYGSNDCKFTMNMKSELEKHDVYQYVEYVDVKTKDGKEEFDEKESYGTPSLHSSLTHKKCIGHVDIEQLIKVLS